MVALYGGDRPQETITADALAFAYPYIILSKPGLFREPNHRDWEAPDFFPQGMDDTVDYTRR